MRGLLNRYVERIVYWYRRWRYRRRPAPRLDVSLTSLVPAWLIRLLASACLISLVAWPAVNTVLPWWISWTAAVLPGLITLWRPGYAPATAAVVLAGLFLIGSPAAPYDPSVVGLAASAYVGFRLSLAASLLPWRGRAQLRVLVSWRDAAILATTLALAGLAWAVTGRGPAWLALPSGLGLVGLALVIGTGLRRSTGRIDAG